MSTRPSDAFVGPPQPTVTASLVADVPGGGSLWVGGTKSPQGVIISPDRMRASLVVDCVGTLTESEQIAQGRLRCIFKDLDTFPSQIRTIAATAKTIAGALRDPAGGDVFIICEYGANRSGLVAALVLRELGLDAPEAIAKVQQARTGSLSNERFRRLVGEFKPGPWEELL